MGLDSADIQSPHSATLEHWEPGANTRAACPDAEPVLARAHIWRHKLHVSQGQFIMTNNGAPEAGAKQPSLNVLGQYLKDFSFENPSAPRSLSGQGTQPNIQIQVNVNVNPVSETDLEVELRIETDATVNNAPMFKVEMVYAGMFRIDGFSPEDRQPVVLIECPRLLFPFARQILADAVRNGGYPPLMIDPIDFVALYRQRLAQAPQAEGQPALN